MMLDPKIPQEKAVKMWREAVARGETELGFSIWASSPFHHTPTQEKEG